MKRWLLPLLFLSASLLSLKAQYPTTIRVVAEYGFMNLSGKLNEHWEFRHTPQGYFNPDYHGNEYATGEGRMHYAGLKVELPTWKSRVTLASGLRYTNVNQQVLPFNNMSHLYLYHPTGRGIDIYRLDEMNESIGYVSVPLEADIILLGYYSNWQVYLKGGIQAGVKVHAKSRIHFTSPSMQTYEDEVLAVAGKRPSAFFSNFYGSLGSRWTLTNGVRVAAEMVTPYLFLSKPNWSFLSSENFPGVQFSIAIPLQPFSLVQPYPFK